MPANVADALSFIVGSIGQLYAFVLILRLLLPWFRADFRNPIAQAILRLTSPLVVPLRRVLPPVGRIDTSTIVVSFGVQYLAIFLILLLVRVSSTVLHISLTALIDLGILSAGLFMLVIFVHILLGWFAPGVYNPATTLVHTMAEPLLRPFRRLVPAMGGIDISPVIPLILFGALIELLKEWRPLPF